jgi:hypothetical protein
MNNFALLILLAVAAVVWYNRSQTKSGTSSGGGTGSGSGGGTGSGSGGGTGSGSGGGTGSGSSEPPKIPEISAPKPPAGSGSSSSGAPPAPTQGGSSSGGSGGNQGGNNTDLQDAAMKARGATWKCEKAGNAPAYEIPSVNYGAHAELSGQGWTCRPL